MTPTLPDLSDRDLLLNLWLTIMALAEGAEVDTDACEQSILRDGMTPDASTPTTTLTDLLAEVESRLGISGGLVSFKQGRRN